MIRSDEETPVDEALFERIVDGWMTPAELRSALHRVESQSGGWRRCATAFLEAQALRESFRALGLPHKEESVCQVLPLHTDGVLNRTHHRWLRQAAAAAIVAGSFAVGWFSHGARMGVPDRDSLSARRSTIQVQPEHQVAESALSSGTRDVSDQDRLEPPLDRDEHAESATGPAITTVARIRFGPESSPTEVPVLAGPGLTEEWLTQQPPPVSEHGQVVLERNGYQVDQRRQFLTATLADGRRVAFPVDHVRIQYTGNEPL